MPEQDYINRILKRTDENSETSFVSDHELLRFDQPLIILAQPGMGKTRLLEMLGKMDGCRFVRATSFLRLSDSDSILDLRLAIDGLDEVAALAEGDALHNVLKKLSSRGKPNFILSCRSSEWRGVSANTDIFDDYGKQPLVLELEPITRDNAFLILSKIHGNSVANDFLNNLDRHKLGSLYSNPLLLELSVAVFRDQNKFSNYSHADIYLRATRVLIQEKNEKHLNSQSSEISKDALLDAAGAAMAAMVITGKTTLRNTSRNSLEETLSGADLYDFANQKELQVALRSNLFSADQRNPTNFVPIHRTIAEFLGARWLDRRINQSECSNQTGARLIGLISAEGCIPASMRGICAWLTYFSSNLKTKLIQLDPYGILTYGDASNFSIDHARILLGSLKALSKEDPFFMGANGSRHLENVLIIWNYMKKFDKSYLIRILQRIYVHCCLNA